jgi:hypothetical protein
MSSLFDEKLALIIGVVLILVSVPIMLVFDRGKSADHLGRTLVSLGVGLIAAFVAVTVFDLNARRLENDREQAAQQAKRSKTLTMISNLRLFAIEYGFVAYQIRATRTDCAAVGAEAGPSDECREAASYAANVGRLVPQDYTLVTSLSEASNAFAKSIRAPTLLTDAEVTIKARMPVVVESFLAISRGAGQPVGTSARDHFLQNLVELEGVAEDASMTYCLFAAMLAQGEASLEQTISGLEGALIKGGAPIHDVILSYAKSANMGDFACSDPRGQIERNLPAAGATR